MTPVRFLTQVHAQTAAAPGGIRPEAAERGLRRGEG
jgi:hypothetical protein